MHVLRAQWAGVAVRPDGAEDVRQVSGEACQPLLGVDLAGRIHWHVVVEHLNPQGAQRQGRRVHHHTDRRPHLTVSNGEVLVVDLEAVRGHRDEVFAGWEVSQCLGGTQLRTNRDFATIGGATRVGYLRDLYVPG